MISDTELLSKIINGEYITCEDLGTHPNLGKCATVIYCNGRTFYSDGVNYYDAYGNLASCKDRKRYDLL